MLQVLKLPYNYRLNEDGELEKYCSRCDEWWPADPEFFFKNEKESRYGLQSWCKACVLEHRKVRHLSLQKDGNLSLGPGMKFNDPFAGLLFGGKVESCPALWQQCSVRF